MGVPFEVHAVDFHVTGLDAVLIETMRQASIVERASPHIFPEEFGQITKGRKDVPVVQLVGIGEHRARVGQ